MASIARFNVLLMGLMVDSSSRFQKMALKSFICDRWNIYCKARTMNSIFFCFSCVPWSLSRFAHYGTLVPPLRSDAILRAAGEFGILTLPLRFEWIRFTLPSQSPSLIRFASDVGCVLSDNTCPLSCCSPDSIIAPFRSESTFVRYTPSLYPLAIPSEGMSRWSLAWENNL